MNSQSFHFESPTMYDFEWYYNLRKRTMFEHFMNAGKGWPEELERARHREGYNPNTLRIICLGDKRIGCINVAKSSEGLHVNAFCVEPEYQRKGYGARVLQQILDEPENRDIPCTLDVLIHNPSYRIYERLGFVRVEGPNPILVYYARPAPPQQYILSSNIMPKP